MDRQQAVAATSEKAVLESEGTNLEFSGVLHDYHYEFTSYTDILKLTVLIDKEHVDSRCFDDVDFDFVDVDYEVMS